MTIHHAALARMLPAEKESYYDSWRNQACRPAAFPSSKRIRRRQSRCRLIRSGCGFAKYDSTATNYNLYVVYRLHGVVDMPMLTEALRHVQARHAILRTRIIVRNDRPCRDR